MPRPTLSVIMPNYNHAKHLDTSLNAVLRQSVDPLEIIIIDDASTDNSVSKIREIIGRFPEKSHFVNLLELKQNQGVVKAMNRGLGMARAEYVYYAAADDEVLPGLFEKSLDLLGKHPRAALSCSICEWREVETGWNRHMGVGMGSSPRFLPPPELLQLEQQGNLLISPHTAVLRRSAILNAGQFREKLKWQCDWFAMYVAAFRDGICFVPEPLAIFNIYDTSYSKKRGSQTSEHKKSLRDLLDALMEAQYNDVRPLIQESGALFLFGKPLFEVVMEDSKYREFRTPAYLRKARWQILRMRVKQFLPRFVANWYFHLCGYKVRNQPMTQGAAGRHK